MHRSSIPIQLPLALTLLYCQIVGGQEGLQMSPLPPQQAMTAGAARPISAPLQISSHRWEFNFHNAPWLLVLRAFAQEFNYTLQISAETEGLFSFYEERLLNSTESIDILNDALLPTGRILIRDSERLTLVNANETIPGNMVPFVAVNQIDELGRNELATVAIPLKSADTPQTVEEVAQLLSPLGQVRVLSNAGRVIVTDTGSYLRRMRDLLLGSGLAAADQHVHVYQLRHASAEEVARAISDFLTGVDQAAGAEPTAAAGQQVVPEATTNSLLVRGTTEELEMIERLVKDLDRAPREVLVQALLVEVELGNVDELGVELGLQDSVLFDRSVLDNLVTITETTTAPNGTQTTNQKVLSQTAAPGFNFPNAPLGNNVAADPGRIGMQGLSTLGTGRINGDLGFGGLVLSAGSESVNILLRALDSTFNVDILSRPQIRAVENKEALIQIGQQVPIVDGVSLSPVGTANPNITQDKAGIILRVTPRISPDARVQLDVEAEKSSFNLTPGTGVPIFSDATNGNVIEAPIKDITTAQTTVSIRSGHTIVLGGMITNDQTNLTRKLPYLGDIPVIGRLFRYDYNRLKRKELLVFLTPTVVENDDHSDQLRQQEMDSMHMPYEAWNMYQPLALPTQPTSEPMQLAPAEIHGASAVTPANIQADEADVQQTLLKRISSRSRRSLDVFRGGSEIDATAELTQQSPLPAEPNTRSGSAVAPLATTPSAPEPQREPVFPRLRKSPLRIFSGFRQVEEPPVPPSTGSTPPRILPRAGYAQPTRRVAPRQ